MSLLKQMLGQMSLEDFKKNHLYTQPFASAATALEFRKLLSWTLLEEIFSSEHSNCLLARSGKLIEDATAPLTLAKALKAYNEGASVVVRHAEKAHLKIAAIAADFSRLFDDPVDVHLYVTPAGEEGFNWHYDIEEVFVIQSSGEKEFFLRESKVRPSLEKVQLPKTLNFDTDFLNQEMRCHLKPGDWLYIPSGIWHKARAVTPSFHLSIGVLSSKRFRT